MTGVRSHIWRPDEGVNPILHMAQLIETLKNTPFTHEPPEIYGPTKPSICPVSIQAGKIGEGQYTLRFAHSGSPSITFGPGEDGWAPVNEYIDIEKVVAATKIYALFLLDFFKVEKS